jgi:hypothetical protein
VWAPFNHRGRLLLKNCSFLPACLQNGEGSVSSLLFWLYIASLATIPACLAVYLQLLQSGVLAGA